MYDTSRRSPSRAESIIGAIIALISIPCQGWVISLIWNWYLVDILKINSIDLRQGIAIGFCLTIIKTRAIVEYPVEAAIRSLVNVAVLLVMIGAYYYLFY